MDGLTKPSQLTTFAFVVEMNVRNVKKMRKRAHVLCIFFGSNDDWMNYQPLWK